eukprot:1141627-Amphidinium_carterae.1
MAKGSRNKPAAAASSRVVCPKFAALRGRFAAVASKKDSAAVKSRRASKEQETERAKVLAVVEQNW